MLRKFGKLLAFGTAIMLGGHLSASEAWAVSIEPLVLDVASSGKGSKHSFKVENEGASPLPVEIIVSRSLRDRAGPAGSSLDRRPASRRCPA
jgi:hypothetical protein